MHRSSRGLFLRLLVGYLAISYIAVWHSILRRRRVVKMAEAQHDAKNSTFATELITHAVTEDPSVSTNCVATPANAVFLVAYNKDAVDWTGAASVLRHVLFYWQSRGISAHMFVFSKGQMVTLQNNCEAEKYCHYVSVPELDHSSDGTLKALAAHMLYDSAACTDLFHDLLVLRPPANGESAAMLDFSVVDRVAVALRTPVW